MFYLILYHWATLLGGLKGNALSIHTIIIFYCHYSIHREYIKWQASCITKEHKGNTWQAQFLNPSGYNLILCIPPDIFSLGIYIVFHSYNTMEYLAEVTRRKYTYVFSVYFKSPLVLKSLHSLLCWVVSFV